MPVNGNCKNELVQSVKNNATPFGVVLIILGAVGLIGMTMSFVICSMHKRKQQGEQKYDFNKWGNSKNE